MKCFKCLLDGHGYPGYGTNAKNIPNIAIYLFDGSSWCEECLKAHIEVNDPREKIRND